jgi:hypothetical protein
MVCLRNISVDTLHKGDTKDDGGDNDDNNKYYYTYIIIIIIIIIIIFTIQAFNTFNFRNKKVVIKLLKSYRNGWCQWWLWMAEFVWRVIGCRVPCGAFIFGDVLLWQGLGYLGGVCVCVCVSYSQRGLWSKYICKKWDITSTIQYVHLF